MGVGERDDVQTANVAAPQVGGDDVFTDFEIARLRRAAGGTACVDQHRAAVGRDHEDGITLTDIDSADLESAGTTRDVVRH
jgi:hypothetical protein